MLEKNNESGALRNTKMYLSSPIEYGNQIQGEWRSKVKSYLTNHFGINVFDPLADEKQKRAEIMEAAMLKGDFDEVEKIATSFVKKDLAEIDRSDFLVAYIPQGVPSTGVPCEVHHSVQLKKPVALVCPQGKKAASRWFWGYLRHRYIFGAWEELYDYLDQVDRFQHKNNHRWWYVYKMV